jgi:NNP family nitrate/nitrite transporter-like MFS transporter
MKKFTSLKGKAFLFLLFLSSLWFLNFAGRAMFSPVLPLIEDEFRISHARASSIFVFQSLGYGVALFFSGFLSGIFGYKKSILCSLLVSAFIFLCIPFVKVFSVLYLFSLVIGLATGIYLPAVIPLITGYYEEKVWGKSIAIHDSAASVGVFGVPIIALFLLDFFRWRGLFAFLGAVFVLAALIFYLLFDELKVGKVSRAALGHFIKNKALWIMSVIWAFPASTSLGVYYIVPLFLTKELHLDIHRANTIFGISRVGGFFVAVSAGFVIGRVSLKKMIASVLIISGGLTIFVALAGVRFIGIALFLQASFIYGFFPAGLTALSRIFDPHVRGIATGFIIGFGVVIGWGVTPFLLGLSGDLLSFKFGIMMLGIATILSSSLVFLLKEISPR